MVPELPSAVSPRERHPRLPSTLDEAPGQRLLITSEDTRINLMHLKLPVSHYRMLSCVGSLR